ncbi:hypothetical protein ACOZFM_27405 [Streptomyces arboris]|uniref:hypothetical protein n=2 Tax=Streptomyces TaxID=1883 RepID=UPI0004C81412
MRVELNDWIRDSADLPMRDPEDPGQFTDEYRHSSKYGPNQAGHRAIAAAIDPAIFEEETTS